MNRDYSKIILNIAIGLAIVQASLFAYGYIKPRTFSSNGVQTVAGTEQAAVAIEQLAMSVEVSSYGGILPHNLAVKSGIENFLQGFPLDSFDSIVLLAPNHLAYGANMIAMADEQFAQGIQPDNEIKDALARTGLVKIDNASVGRELAINALLPLFKKQFPDKKINLLIFKNQPNDKASEVIARGLGEVGKKKRILVLATVDFSHYQPRAVADFHDLESQATIENFDFAKVRDLEIDAPAVLLTALKYFSFSNASKPVLVEHSNTVDYGEQEDAPSTSHFFYRFEKGVNDQAKQASILAFGDLMLDRGVRQIIDRKGFDYLFADLKGEEGRFLMGSDYVSANLEGAVTLAGEHQAPVYANDFAFRPADIKNLKQYNFNIFSLANNHVLDQGLAAEEKSRVLLGNNGYNYFGCHDRQVGDCTSYISKNGSTSIAWLGFSQVYGKLDQGKVVEKIKQAKTRADFVVVNIHWGSEYQSQFSQAQQTLAHAMVEAGSDVIIGHHPHVVQGVEQYRDGLIFYSLGNFIFDQYFSIKTQEGLGLGINLTEKKIEAFVFPLSSVRSQPELISGARKKVFLRDLANISSPDDNLRKQLELGSVVIEK